jgi:hypothetical protein
MNKKIFLAIAISMNFILLFFAFSSKAQNVSSDSVALRTLKSFQKVINQDNYKLFGLKSPDEISNLRLGSPPITVYLVRLDSLRKFQGGDGRNLLTNINQIIYPVYSNNNLVSSIKLEYDKKNWVVEGFGDREIIQYYQNASKNLNTSTPNKTYLIKIPSLNIFLFAAESNIINVELLGNQQIGELKPNVTTTLQDALVKIKPIANTYNGLPW